MRIDLLLKRLCLVKSRTQGQKGCEAGFVKINGRRAKPGGAVHTGDIVEIRYPRAILVLEIIEPPGRQVPRKDRDRYYRVIRETALESDYGVWDA
jgi:ribosomal 50S subunit-recycling heat shock protein